MKILVSSKYLATELNKIDQRIMLAELHVINREDPSECNLLLHYESGRIALRVAVLAHTTEMDQSNCRWDWVRDLMNAIEEQPVSLDITENKVKVTFEY